MEQFVFHLPRFYKSLFVCRAVYIYIFVINTILNYDFICLTQFVKNIEIDHVVMLDIDVENLFDYKYLYVLCVCRKLLDSITVCTKSQILYILIFMI